MARSAQHVDREALLDDLEIMPGTPLFYGDGAVEYMTHFGLELRDNLVRKGNGCRVYADFPTDREDVGNFLSWSYEGDRCVFLLGDTRLAGKRAEFVQSLGGTLTGLMKRSRKMGIKLMLATSRLDDIDDATMLLVNYLVHASSESDGHSVVTKWWDLRLFERRHSNWRPEAGTEDWHWVLEC